MNSSVIVISYEKSIYLKQHHNPAESDRQREIGMLTVRMQYLLNNYIPFIDLWEYFLLAPPPTSTSRHSVVVKINIYTKLKHLTLNLEI